MKIKFGNFLPFAFLLVVAGLSYYLFIELDILPDNEKRLTGIFTTLGLSFGVFQFWLSEINNSRRRDFDLRYESYKEFRAIVDSVTEILNEEMVLYSNNPHSTVTKLLNLLNQFQTSVKVNSEFLFKGLMDKEPTKKLRDKAEEILVRTDKYRKSMDDLRAKNADPGMVLLADSIERMNWHNDTRELLKELHDMKYAFYKAVREYF